MTLAANSCPQLYDGSRKIEIRLSSVLQLPDLVTDSEFTISSMSVKVYHGAWFGNGGQAWLSFRFVSIHSVFEKFSSYWDVLVPLHLGAFGVMNYQYRPRNGLPPGISTVEEIKSSITYAAACRLERLQSYYNAHTHRLYLRARPGLIHLPLYSRRGFLRGRTMMWDLLCLHAGACRCKLDTEDTYRYY